MCSSFRNNKHGSAVVVMGATVMFSDRLEMIGNKGLEGGAFHVAEFGKISVKEVSKFCNFLLSVTILKLKQSGDNIMKTHRN